MRVSMLIFLMLPMLATAQMSKELPLLVMQFGGKNIVYGKSVGFAGTTPGEFSAFEQFVEKASEEDLLYYLEHTDATVQAYAFWALAVKFPARARREIEALKNNKSEFNLMLGGCIISTSTLGDFCQQRLDGPMSYLFSSAKRNINSNSSTY